MERWPQNIFSVSRQLNDFIMQNHHKLYCFQCNIFTPVNQGNLCNGWLIFHGRRIDIDAMRLMTTKWGPWCAYCSKLSGFTIAYTLVAIATNILIISNTKFFVIPSSFNNVAKKAETHRIRTVIAAL